MLKRASRHSSSKASRSKLNGHLKLTFQIFTLFIIFCLCQDKFNCQHQLYWQFECKSLQTGYIHYKMSNAYKNYTQNTRHSFPKASSNKLNGHLQLTYKYTRDHCQCFQAKSFSFLGHLKDGHFPSFNLRWNQLLFVDVYLFKCGKANRKKL